MVSLPRRPRLGLCILPEHRWRDAAALWRAGEELGFDHLWTYDHLGWRTLVDRPWFDAVPTLTAAATVTERVPLGFFVASPNFRHPVSFVRQLLAIDDVSGGRLQLGIGAGGGGGYDDTVLGQAPITAGQRVRRLAEFTELTDRLLRQPLTTYRGEFFTAVEARSAPGPVQRPRPPLWIAANRPKAMTVAARWGDGWMTTGVETDDVDEWWRGVGEQCVQMSEIEATSRDPARAPLARLLNGDAGPVFSLTSLDALTEVLGRATEAGFTDVVVHRPRPSGVYAGDPAILERVAAEVLTRPV